VSEIRVADVTIETAPEHGETGGAGAERSSKKEPVIRDGSQSRERR
jgi:hypothetical protein